MADGGSQYKYKLIIDAEEAQATAARLRQMIEGELSQMDLGQAMARAQGTSGGGGMAGAVAQTQAAIKSADQQLDEMAQKFAKMDAHELRAGMTQAVADARELRSVLEGIQPPKVNTAQMRAQLEEFYNAYAHFNEQTPDFIAARSQGLVPHMGVLQMGRGEIDGAKLAPPDEWSVNTAGAMKAARTSEQEYAQAQVKYYEALATEAKAGEALLEKLVGEMGTDDGVAKVMDEYEQLGSQTRKWAEQEAEALGGLGQAQAELARITQEIEAEAQAAIVKANNLTAVKAADFSALAGGGGGGRADATIRITATDPAAKAYERIAVATAEIATNSERASKAEASSAASIAKNMTYYAEMESSRRKEEMSARNAMAIAEKQVEIQRTSTQQAKTQTQEQAALAQLARAAATEQVEGERRLSAVTSAETTERKQLARAEATERIELARQTTATVKGEQQRETANLREELRQQRTAVQQSSVMSVGGVTGGMSRLGRGLVGAGIGALGLYGIEGTARTLYNAGEQGAQQLRTMETFEALAQRIGVSADEMVGAVKSAANDTITEFDAISYGAQILAQRFATSSEDIVGDTAKLIEFSRRLSQIYTDEQGNFMSTQEVFGRLVKFTREGNKELVDQFGLSNKLIADIMGVPLDGLASATGAITRWQGMLEFAGQEMERLGPSTASVADEFQASTARIENAMNRIRQASAKPVAIVVEVVADAADIFSQGSKNSALEGQLATLLGQAPGELQSAVLQQQSGWNDGMSRAAGLFSNEWLAESIQYIETTIPIVQNLTEAYTLLGTAQADGSLDPKATADARMEWERIVDQMEAGTLAGDDLTNRTQDFINGLREALGLLVANTVQADALGGAMEAAAQTPYQKIMEARGPRDDSLTALQRMGASLPYATGSTPQERRTAELLSLTDERLKLEEQIAKDRTALDKQTATAAESAWRGAAAKTQQAFDSAISKIPGIGGTSAVTEEDMAKAKAGLAVNYADDYLRRLEDEIVNKKDWAGVDVGDAARRMGMDPGTDPNVVLQQMKSQWSSGELFAGGKNLDLVNLDAVKAAYEQQARQEDGQKELRRYVGQALGINVDAMDAQAQATYATTSNTTSLDENTAALDAVNQQIAELNAAPAPGTAPAVGAATTPAPYQYTDAQRQVWADAQARAIQIKLDQGVQGAGVDLSGGTVPESTMDSQTASANRALYTSGTVPMEGETITRPEITDHWANSGPALDAEQAQMAATGATRTGGIDLPALVQKFTDVNAAAYGPKLADLGAQAVSKADLPAIGPDLPAVAGGMISTLLGSGGGGLSALIDQLVNSLGGLGQSVEDAATRPPSSFDGPVSVADLSPLTVLLAQYMGGAVPESTMTPAAIGEAVAEAVSGQAVTTGGMVPNAVGGYSPTVGMPNPAGLIDMLLTGAQAFATTVDGLVHAAQPETATATTGEIPQSTPPSTNPLAGLIDQFLSGGSYGPALPGKDARATASGPQDMVEGTTVITPWAASPPKQVPLPQPDAAGYGRPLIAGLDTPPGFTSSQAAGDTLTTPAPYTDIRQQPTTGLSDALLPSWLTGATTETVSKGTGTTLYLPLVANQAEIDTALGSQPEDIAARMMDRISLSFGDVEVVAPLWSGWQKDLSNNGDKLEETGISVGKLFQGGFIKGLKGDGNFVAEIVAAVLESLAGQDQ